jgi:hypothetical protein
MNNPGAERNRDRKSDLPDSPKDKEELKNEDFTIDLPDVKDIPGQEHINVPPLRQFSDTTISSDDEEGRNVFENADSNVSREERDMLDRSANDMPTTDDINLRRAALDSRDDDGEPLNEGTSENALSGSDLDVPGAETDDENEEIGEEDEENNPYSLGGDDQSVNEERSGT